MAGKSASRTYDLVRPIVWQTEEWPVYGQVTDAATRLTRLLNTWRLLKSNLIFLFADWSTWIHSEKAFITAQCREWGSGANASELSSKDQPLAVARLVLSSKAISDPSV